MTELPFTQRRAAPNDSILVAISFVKFERSQLIVSYGLCKEVTIRGVSATRNASFEFRTKLLPPNLLAGFERLEQYGFLVAAVPSRWEYTPKESWQAEAMQLAMNLIEMRHSGGGMHTLVNYDEKLRHQVLETLNKPFPNAINMIELKRGLSPEPSDNQLLGVLDGLIAECFIEVSGMRKSECRLEEFGLARITDEGREQLPPAPVPSTTIAGGFVIHGDQIINHGSVGSIGSYSRGTISLHRATRLIEPDVDLKVLVKELEELRTQYRKIAISREDDRQLSYIGDAAEELEKGNTEGAATVLAKLGSKALDLAKDLGVEVAAKVLQAMITG